MPNQYYLIHVLFQNANKLREWLNKHPADQQNDLLVELINRIRDESCKDAELDPSCVKLEQLDTQANFVRFSVQKAIDAHQLADRILSAKALSLATNLDMHIGIGIASGNKADILALGTEAERIAQSAAVREIVISDKVYADLPPSSWDYYGEQEMAANFKIRRAYPSGFNRCFVISPFGKPQSEIRKRSDFVFEKYIKPACADQRFRPVRSDKQLSEAIHGDMTAALATDPVVIAYVGKPPWNANVMIEIGYRLAIRNPIVFLCDALIGWDPPFNLLDRTFIQLPAEDSESEVEVKQAISRISQALAQPDRGYFWSSEHPFAEIDIDTVHQKQVILGATREAEHMFAMPGKLTNVPVRDVITRLRQFMPEDQFKAFAKEQGELIGRLATLEKGGSVSDVFASIPMFFESHPDKKYREKAFLPVIVRHRENSGKLTLEVVYLDVSSVTRVDEGGRFIAQLGERGEVTGLIWDLYAISYDRILPELSFYQEVLDLHQKAMSRKDVNDVLELGAGTGNLTMPLLEQGQRVVAVDISRSMLDVMRRKVQERDNPKDRILIIEHSAEHIPGIRDKRFDGVSIMLALFAMEQPEKALNEGIRVLRTHGRIIITEPKDCFRLEPLLDLARQELEKCGLLPDRQADWNRVMQVNRHINPELKAPLRAERIKSILEKRGFHEIQMTDAYHGNCATIEAVKQT